MEASEAMTPLSAPVSLSRLVMARVSTSAMPALPRDCRKSDTLCVDLQRTTMSYW